MIQSKNIGKLTEISSTNGYVHKIGTEIFFKKGVLPTSDTVDMYEEVTELPKYTEQEYKEKVRELIAERYTIEDEIALYRQKDRKLDEFLEYDSFCEECKIKVKEILNNGEESRT